MKRYRSRIGRSFLLALLVLGLSSCQQASGPAAQETEEGAGQEPVADKVDQGQDQDLVEDLDLDEEAGEGEADQDLADLQAGPEVKDLVVQHEVASGEEVPQTIDYDDGVYQGTLERASQQPAFYNGNTNNPIYNYKGQVHKIQGSGQGE